MSTNARPDREPQKKSAPPGHVIVCGLGRFGLRIVQCLREQQIEVVIITAGRETRADRKSAALALGAYLVEGDFRFPEVRQAARVDDAQALILASASDGANLETALDVRQEAPQVRIVMRLEVDAFAQRLQTDFGIHAVLSPSVLAASAFADAALAEKPAAQRAARTTRQGEAPGLPRRLRAGVGSASAAQNILFGVLLTLLLLFLFGVLVFRDALHISLVDAIYFTATIVTTVGFGDFHLREASDGLKLFGVLMMFGGVVLIAVLSSFLTNFVLSGAATQLRAERLARRMRDHVILCGLGSVGFEVAEALLKRRIPLVVVDATPDDAHARNLSVRVPLLAGDAVQPDTLRAAGIAHARAVIAATSSDAVNLEIGLMSQSLTESLRSGKRGTIHLVLRCFDPALASRIHAASDAYTLLSSAEIAAPVFVAEALRRD